MPKLTFKNPPRPRLVSLRFIEFHFCFLPHRRFEELWRRAPFASSDPRLPSAPRPLHRIGCHTTSGAVEKGQLRERKSAIQIETCLTHLSFTASKAKQNTVHLKDRPETLLQSYDSWIDDLTLGTVVQGLLGFVNPAVEVGLLVLFGCWVSQYMGCMMGTVCSGYRYKLWDFLNGN